MIASLLFMSCDPDDDNNDDDGGNGTVGTELNGVIDADTTLDPSVQYRITGTATVADGVTLTIPAGTEIVSDAGTENYLAVLKGGTIDIQGTESAPVVMRSNGTAGAWGGLVICGDASTTEGTDATAEVGGLIYGGSNDSDSSGSVEYLIIRDAGAQINADSQFNGLTLYAVGYGTNIDNVAIINGTDDGVEFFGGTVNASNFYLENNEDDAIDWTEGWNGTLTNAYVTNDIDFSTIVEADGQNNNPTLVNLTGFSTVGGTAIQIKNASGATIDGLSLAGFDQKFDFPGDSDEEDLQIDDEDADENDTFDSSSTTAGMFTWATDFVSTSTLPATISSNTTLNPEVQYTINGSVVVQNGVTLTIPAGTEIVSEVGTDNYLAVLKGGDIIIEGTEENPVTMRSNGAAGSWGGLVVCGNATTTEGVDATAEVGGLIYGGSDDNDSSGSIEYLIIRDAGAQINADSQFNGLTLYAVGDGTTIDNVAIINGTDDGVEFFGGTVDASNFYLENNEDDAIDWTEGWNGSLTNAFVRNTIAFSTIVEADGVNNMPEINDLTGVSTVGGTAIQIKNASGAVIDGLSLTGFDQQFDFPGSSTEADLQIDGADADEAGSYDDSDTEEDDFDWVN